jgi:AraC-like DNA-binding protein
MRTEVARERYWSTASVEPARAFKFWVDTLCSELVELRVESRSSDAFEAWLLQKALGPVKLNFIYTRDPQDVWRTQAAINRSSHESRFYLIYVRNGRFTFDHYDRSFAVGTNECVLIDSTEPYYFRSSEFAAGTSIQIPHKWLSSWIALPKERVGQVVTGTTPWGTALLATLAALEPKSIEQLALPGEVVSEQIASLLTLAISPSSRPDVSKRRNLLPDVQHCLREHAHDETLTPAAVAQMHGISKRYLHALFAKAGTTFSRELMNVRLERALRHLGDARFRDLTVSEIAWRCGFTDSSHFARRFVQRYGISPRAHRRVALPGAQEESAGP